MTLYMSKRKYDMKNNEAIIFFLFPHYLFDRFYRSFKI